MPVQVSIKNKNKQPNIFQNLKKNLLNFLNFEKKIWIIIKNTIKIHFFSIEALKNKNC